MAFRVLYFGSIIAAAVLLAALAWYRGPAEAPWCLYLAVSVVAPVAIWVDIEHRRRKRSEVSPDS